MKLIAINPPVAPITDPQIPDAIARDSEVIAAVESAPGNFGQINSHAQFADINTPVTQRGWSFVSGTLNTPTNNQTYRLNTALGSEYGIGTYALELGIPRFGEKRLFCRRQEGGAWDDWGEFLPRNVIKTFNSGATQGSVTNTTHGLDTDKILSYEAMLMTGINGSLGFSSIVKPGGVFGSPGYTFLVYIDATKIFCRLHSTDSGLILNKAIKVCFLI
ncbi:hypothetical protein [Kamptonema sp. UHCC 0994]|uniref:hypothetical protein n=1 Tax=Kamptonema sp. UHCC 0994 TaxID=3031329 RepID=UPI0023BA3159|nr:hypothetical protein [Kamptonema sp. UHCC 0994]MDF0553881.1 hypothetical protein [Kamptonema sp. UHCC 0994]